jgi:hypothetical protein
LLDGGLEARMTCPYRKEVSMVFCRAYPVKKLVPIDRVTTASSCEGEGYKACALYAEAASRSWRGTVDEDETLEGAGHA